MTSLAALAWLSIAAFLPHAAFSWDLAVTVGEHIEFFQSNGSGLGAASRPFNELSSITYDSVYETLYFSDNKHEDTSIFSYKLDPSKDFQPLLERKFSENVEGIAFDPMIETLFWTDGKKKSISRMSLMPGSNPNRISNVLLNFTNGEQPKAITVDSCRGYIYWTNIQLHNPTIERMTVDGKNRTVIVKNDLFTPLGITIDQATKKICWTDDKEGSFYTIECSDLDGSNRMIIDHGKNHQPYSLVVNNGMVYWTDWTYKTIWKKALVPNEQSAPISLKNFTHVLPNGIVAKINLLEQITGVPECKGLEKLILNITNKQLMPQDEGVLSNTPTYCLNGGKYIWKLDSKMNPKICECARGYTGERCEISLCYNYCLNGTCQLNREGFPQCRCYKGFYGERCSKSVCKGYCLNNGSCEINDNKEAICTCLPGWIGSRCEEKNQTIPDCEYEEHKMNKIVLEEKITNSVIERENSSPGTENKNMNRSFTLLSSAEPSELNIFEETNNCFGWNAGLPIVTFLSSLCLVLSIIIVILVKKVIILKRRPRIKKRIIVNKNVTPLTCRPNPQQCEITIENCCNMNVCETPCFEPNSIRAQIADMTAKDEKKQLLLNQELHDGTY